MSTARCRLNALLFGQEESGNSQSTQPLPDLASVFFRAPLREMPGFRLSGFSLLLGYDYECHEDRSVWSINFQESVRLFGFA